jgi:sugar phosphate isomerase/epimerase
MRKAIFYAFACSLMLVSCGQGGQGSKTAEEQATPKKEIGVQLYSVRDAIRDEGFDTVIKELAGMGYTYVEAAGYNDQEGTLYGLKPEDYKAKLEAVGLKSMSTHIGHALSAEELKSGDFTESMKWWDKAIADHKAAGCQYIVTPSFPVPDNLKDLKTYCDYFNAVGKKCAENGISYGYHNHSHEFNKVEDQVVYTFMVENTDPQYVFFEMDVYWAVMGHAYPVELFRKYPGRFKMLHIKDHFELGESGMVGFDAIFNNAETAGMKHYIVELEAFTDGNWRNGMKKCADYLLNSSFVKETYSE